MPLYRVYVFFVSSVSLLLVQTYEINLSHYSADSSTMHIMQKWEE